MKRHHNSGQWFRRWFRPLVVSAGLCAVVVGCGRDGTPVAVQTPPPPASQPDDPLGGGDDPRGEVLTWETPQGRDVIERAASTPITVAAFDAFGTYAFDPSRSFVTRSVERGHENMLVFMPMLSLTDPDEAMLVVYGRSNGVEGIDAARVRRAVPGARSAASFRQYGSLWWQLHPEAEGPSAGKWNDEQKADFVDCLVKTHVVGDITCVLECAFTGIGFPVCTFVCMGANHIVSTAGCAVYVAVKGWLGGYKPKDNSK